MARKLIEDLYNRGVVARASASVNDAWRLGRRWVPGDLPQRLTPFPGDFPRTGLPELARVGGVLMRRRLGVARGSQVRRLEQEMAALLQVRFAVACSSGTAALTLALSALDIGPGDEVIVPAVTYMATAMAVLHVGATPVFADVTLPDGNLDPVSVAERIRPTTKALIAVHLSGTPAPLERLQALCDEHNVRLIEDVAQAAGAKQDGRALGSLGDLGCFSFNMGKNMTTGEGGLVVTNDPELARRVQLSVHLGEAHEDGTPLYADWTREGPHRFERVGWNFKMSELHGAVGRAQVRRFPALIARRRDNGEALRRSLSEIPEVRVPEPPAGATPAWWRLPVQVTPPLNRDAVVEGLRRERITCYPPNYTVLPDNPIFPPRQPLVPRSRRFQEEILFIPTHPNLSWRELRDVAPALKRVVRRVG